MTLWLAMRYSFSPQGRHRSRSIRLAFTIAVSMAAVLIIISIMEFLQEGRLERIRDVRSFDTVVEGDFSDEISALYPDFKVFSYGEADALISGHAARIRFIDDDYDGGVMMLGGEMDSLVVSYPMLFSLPDSHSASVMLLSEGKSGRVLPSSYSFPISGVYTTAMGREFDELYAFMPLDSMPAGIGMHTAVKGRDVSKELSAIGYDAVSWKESESALYSAFMLEKMMMYMVLLLLFIIISVSMKQTVRIFYEERTPEIAELMILGMNARTVRMSFRLSFLMILAIGILAGYILALVLMPVAGNYLDAIFHRGRGLRVPYDGLFFLSLFLIAVTLIFTAKAGRRAERSPLEDILHE